MIENFGGVYLLIDALDEFADLTKLVKLIRQMRQWSMRQLHILLTSQAHPIPISDYMEQLSLDQLIDMEKLAGDADIRLHIRQTLEHAPELGSRWVRDPGHVLQLIEDTLVKKADSSYVNATAICHIY
jgi:hypothetical protein